MAYKINGKRSGAALIGLQDQDAEISEPGLETAGVSSGNTTQQDDAEVLSGLIGQMYDTFATEELTVEEKSEDEMREQIASWLRPAYDQAILNRQAKTVRQNASLDADAIARGMGSSTYVTDVKSRQYDSEASDILGLEADYGAALAKQVSESEQEQNDQILNALEYNAAQRQNAYELAYDAAQMFFTQYLKTGRKTSASSKAAATSAENVETFLSLLSGEERGAVYSAATEENARYRAEILASVGYLGYLQLRAKYPESP